MPVIYIDILLSLNLFIDFLLLAATARLLSRPLKRRRAVLAALIGAASSLIILIPPLSSLLSLGFQAVVSLVMVLTAFPLKGVGTFFKTTTVLWVVSGMFSGIMTAGYYLLTPPDMVVQSGVVYYNVSPLLLIGLTTLSYGILCLFDRFSRKRAALGFCYRLEIIDDDHRVTVRAMLDSGHSLQDSFSGAPVILVKESAVRELRSRYDLAAPHGLRGGRIRYIPFSSIGGDGVLIAFRPEHVTLFADNRHVDISGVWIATTTVLGRGEYDALIGPAVADMLYQPTRQ